MKTLMNISIKVQRIVGFLSRMQSRMSITFKCIFLGEDHLWFFLQKGNIIFVTFIHMYIYTENVLFPCIFWERSSFIFRPKKKYYIFQKKKITIFADNTWKIIFHRDFIWKDHLFVWEMSSLFFCLKSKIIFSGKRNIIFPDNTAGKITLECDFFGKTIFSEDLKKASYCIIFLRKSIFHFPSKEWDDISGKRKYHLSRNTRKIMLHRDFFKRPSFQNIWKNKI